ncbi:MAG: NAD-dependent epimerase/dehydratase family protein [Erysipelotrichaceae bacterium]|nr:NAD-dependent epimerase/dehydratase family protein [Erysipelotrichaceae bacterium]
MKVLVTGSNGFVGKNLVNALLQIQKGNDKTRPELQIDEVYQCDVNTNEETLSRYCSDCDFVFNLAGVNRPKDPKEFADGNFNFLLYLLKNLSKFGNKCPVMLSSSIQASLVGRYKDSEYGKSKFAAEKLLLEYGKRIGVRTYIYRFPNLFGKWCKPNYNSVIATFCYNYARNKNIKVNDPNTELELVYIDDLVNAMLDAMEGKECRCDYDGLDVIKNPEGKYCYVPISYKVTLGQIVKTLDIIRAQPKTLMVPELRKDGFTKKLYSTYLSYLPKENTIFDLRTREDERGSFTELVKTVSGGQFSVNISKPGVSKGQHFHNSKWEFFIVVKGRALIRERNLSNGDIYEFIVSGDKLQAVHMLPGFTHSIKNLDTENELITMMWANEPFDQKHPDTFYEEV